MTDDMYLPIHYLRNVVKKPHFKGVGEHSVRELEELCKQYEKFFHQQQIIKQNCMKRIVELKFDIDFKEPTENEL